MSLILDALRKMEQERKSRLGGSVDIRPEVLRYRGAAAPRPQPRKPYLQIAAAVVLVAGGIGAGVFLKGGSRDPSAPEVPAAAVEERPAVPSAPVQQAVAPQLLPPPPAALPAQPPVPQAPAAAIPPAPTLPVERPAARGALVPRGAQAARHSDPVQPALSSVDDGDAADIAVSGIAWQEERGLRRAVVNGALVGEGAEVAGARVVEIRETRVRFSRGGRTFDVSYSSTLGH